MWYEYLNPKVILRLRNVLRKVLQRRCLTLVHHWCQIRLLKRLLFLLNDWLLRHTLREQGLRLLNHLEHVAAQSSCRLVWFLGRLLLLYLHYFTLRLFLTSGHLDVRFFVVRVDSCGRNVLLLIFSVHDQHALGSLWLLRGLLSRFKALKFEFCGALASFASVCAHLACLVWGGLARVSSLVLE